MSLKHSVGSMLYKTTGRVLVDPDRFNIVPIAPSPTQEQQPISRELSEAEYRELSAEDDYHGETVTRFRVARALLYANSGQLVVVEPGLLLLAIMIERFGRPVSTLEFGGGTDYHYTTLNRIMPGAIQRYTIIETVAQVKATHGRIPFIDFSSDIPIGSFDIIFSSGALQCTDRPSDYLDALCALGAPVMSLLEMHSLIVRLFSNRGHGYSITAAVQFQTGSKTY
jgi:hypothetical protein